VEAIRAGVAALSRIGGGPDDDTERIDLVAALTAFTRGSAYLNHDDEAGVLAPGMRADLAVIDRDLFDRSLGQIADATVEMTIASGSVVFGA
jgi:predicted amidohydrolase YtcJ